MHGQDREEAVHHAQLAKQKIDDGTSAPSGASSATGVNPSAAMPPMTASTAIILGGASSMTPIREERERSQI